MQPCLHCQEAVDRSGTFFWSDYSIESVPDNIWAPTTDFDSDNDYLSSWTTFLDSNIGGSGVSPDSLLFNDQLMPIEISLLSKTVKN